MDGEAIIQALLRADAAVVASVGARVYPSELPADAEFPALVTTPISAVPSGHLDAAAEVQITRGVVEVMAIAGDTPTIAALVRAVNAACAFQRGAVAGVHVIAIEPGSRGERARDPRTGYQSQPVTFVLHYVEP